MAFLRLTLLEPRRGSEDEVLALLEELDGDLAGAPGMMMSLVLHQDARQLGRVSLWQTRDGANREAASAHVLSLRSRLHYLSVTTEERLLEVSSVQLPAGFAALQEPARLRVSFPSSAQQMALPVE